MNLLGVLINSV